jgi:hypothetical protein
MHPLDLLGLWFGFYGVFAIAYVVYRIIYHARRSLKIARAMNR